MEISDSLSSLALETSQVPEVSLSIPADILRVHILSRLSSRHVAKVRLVCKEWSRWALSSLKRIDDSESPIRDSDLFYKAFSCMTSLEVLSVSYHSLKGEWLNKLLTEVAISCPRMRRLRTIGNSSEEMVPRVLEKLLRSCPGLEVLHTEMQDHSDDGWDLSFGQDAWQQFEEWEESNKLGTHSSIGSPSSSGEALGSQSRARSRTLSLPQYLCIANMGSSLSDFLLEANTGLVQHLHLHLPYRPDDMDDMDEATQDAACWNMLDLAAQCHNLISLSLYGLRTTASDGIEKLAALGGLSSLHHLSVDNIQWFTREPGVPLPAEWCNLKAMKTFSMIDFPHIVDFDVLCQLPLLEKLSMRDCDTRGVPEGISRLTAIRSIALEGCGSGNGLVIPESIGLLTSLQSLSFKYSTLVSLPISIGDLPRLEFLDISSCSGLSSVPELLANAVALREVKALRVDETVIAAIRRLLPKVRLWWHTQWPIQNQLTA